MFIAAAGFFPAAAFFVYTRTSILSYRAFILHSQEQCGQLRCSAMAGNYAL